MIIEKLFMVTEEATMSRAKDKKLGAYCRKGILSPYTNFEAMSKSRVGKINDLQLPKSNFN
jgi:hypothetical protein